MWPGEITPQRKGGAVPGSGTWGAGSVSPGPSSVPRGSAVAVVTPIYYAPPTCVDIGGARGATNPADSQVRSWAGVRRGLERGGEERLPGYGSAGPGPSPRTGDRPSVTGGGAATGGGSVTGGGAAAPISP